METGLIVALIGFLPAFLASLAAWKNVKANCTGTLHQKLDRLEGKLDRHIEWHLEEN